MEELPGHDSCEPFLRIFSRIDSASQSKCLQGEVGTRTWSQFTWPFTCLLCAELLPASPFESFFWRFLQKANSATAPTTVRMAGTDDFLLSSSDPRPLKQRIDELMPFNIVDCRETLPDYRSSRQSSMLEPLKWQRGKISTRIGVRSLLLSSKGSVPFT